MVRQKENIKQRLFTIMLSATLLSAALLSPFNGSVFADNRFTDIDTHWGKDFINKAKEYELIAGMPDGTFQPNNEISYAEFLTILLRVMNIEPISNNDSYWGTPYLRAAQQAGLLDMVDASITEEYGRAKINRIDMACILSTAIGKLGIAQDTTPPVLHDIGMLTTYQQESLQTVLKSGIMGGSPTGEFSPFNHSTRAQLAVVFVNLQDKKNAHTPAKEQPQKKDSYNLGDVFPADAAYTFYTPNPETIWALSGEDENFQFYILDTESHIIGRKTEKLPDKQSTMSLTLSTYKEHLYNESVFWVYYDFNVQEDIMILELNPQWKRSIESAPTCAKELADFELITEYMTNFYRTQKSLAPLKHNDHIQRFARSYAEKMATQHFFGHTSPDGTTFQDRIESSGLAYSSASENIAYNYSNPINLVVAWINSPSHKEGILSSNKEIGIGAALSDNGEVLAAQVFFTLR